MKSLNNIVEVSTKDKPFIDFEKSIDDDQVVSGYIPVKSTIDILKFLRSATAAQTSESRGVICWGNYGTGKSRMCVLLARLLKDGFNCPALEPVFERLKERGCEDILLELKQIMMPAEMEWRKWLIVPMYAQAEGGTIGAALTKALIKAIKDNNLDQDTILGQTIFQAAANRLIELVEKLECEFIPIEGSTYADYKNLERALLDLDEQAIEEFKVFHKQVSGDIDFNAYLATCDRVVMKVHEVYNLAVDNIKDYGYAGIAIIWDEFGFAVEKLLKRNSLEDEVLELQDFLQKACSNDHYDQRVIFLGFTHVSLSEYGTRANLDEISQNRLKTVEDRFRDPSIRVTLGITESEGYHLLGGLTLKTEKGKSLFKNPIKKLQKIAVQMSSFGAWDQLSISECYDDIVTSCYPLHPAASIALLILSDQIAQQNRTSFYFMQNRDTRGLAWFLENTELPIENEIGKHELMRIHHLFEFFEQALMEEKRILYEQYIDAVSLYPGAEEIDKDILKAILIMRVIANPDIISTTNFLCFCINDCKKDEVDAAPVHAALEKLTKANVIWKNDSTEVWDFVGGRGINAGIDAKLRKEKRKIVKDKVSNLLLMNKKIQPEIFDYFGEIELEPATSGIVRKVDVELLDFKKGIARKIKSSKDGWLSGIIYLVFTESAQELSQIQDYALQFQEMEIYFVIPKKPHDISSEDFVEIIAILNLLLKSELGEHEFSVLEGKLTHRRNEIREKFEKLFGNEGFRKGTIVVKAGLRDEIINPSSWNKLFKNIGVRIESTYNKQIKVRCGTYNQWNEDKNWKAIKNIVSRILQFENTPETQDQFLGFSETSQEAAIIDGVLIENGYLVQDPILNKWALIEIKKTTKKDVLSLIYSHFLRKGKSRNFETLYNKLIDKPYGIPNGVIPLLVALAIRKIKDRIGFLKVKNNKQQPVAPTKIAEAIVKMGKGDDYATRYQGLNIKQRLMFYLLDSVLEDITVFEGDWSKDPEFISHCDKIKIRLHNWLKEIPKGILDKDEFGEKEKRFIKIFRLLTPPQLTDIADKMLEIYSEKEALYTEEIETADINTKEYPNLKSYLINLKTNIAIYEEGIRKGVEEQIMGAINVNIKEKEDLSKVAEGMKLLAEESGNKNLEKIAVALTGDAEIGNPMDLIVSELNEKPTSKLTDEDYAKAVGFFNAVITPKEKSEHGILTLPTGEKHILKEYEYNENVKSQVKDKINSWCTELECEKEEITFIILDAIYNISKSDS